MTIAMKTTFISLIFIVLFHHINSAQCSSNAGIDGTVCGLTYSLSGSISGLPGSTALWTSDLPGTVFTNATQTSTTVTIPNFFGMFQIVNFTLTETNTSIPCSSNDVVTIYFYNIQPAIHLVDPADSITCGSTFMLLNAISPAYGSGYWIDTVPNTVFTPSPANPSPSVTINTNYFGYHNFYWITVNAMCRDTSEVVRVNFVERHISNAGNDTLINGLTSHFNATLDSGFIGTWYALSGNFPSIVSDVNSPNSPVTASQSGVYNYIWSVQNIICVDNDTVQLTFDNTFVFLNPINNLYFLPWYIMPNNYFMLNWSPPNPSTTDTLVGYNIYRDNVLYRFQTDTSMYHSNISGSNCPESFLGGDGVVTPPFYIHVTAVYNTSHIESSYNDSTLCMGLALDSKEIQDDNFEIEISPNPFTDNFCLKGKLKNIEDISFELLNSLGQKIKCNPTKSFTQGEFTYLFSTTELIKGMYYLKITIGQKVYLKKLTKINSR